MLGGMTLALDCKRLNEVMKKILWLELGLLCLYFMDILALQFSHLDFWMLTFAFLGAGAEVGFGVFSWTV